MRKILNIDKRHMVRPMICHAITRLSAGLALALLWDHFVNTEALLSVGVHAFFVVGIFLTGMAWFDYLKLDGMHIHHLSVEKSCGRKMKNHHRKAIIDFSDERINSFEELEADEQAVCRLGANLLAGAVFLGLSLINTVLW